MSLRNGIGLRVVFCVHKQGYIFTKFGYKKNYKS